MGTTYLFRCNKCNYEVKSSGGEDRGFIAFTNTYICYSCKSIVDITEKVLSTNKKVENKEDRFRYLEIFCPKCGSKTELEKWDNVNAPCPKCDGKMERGGLISMWD